MMLRNRFALAALVGVALLAGSVQAADLTASLKNGTPDLKSAGPLAFGPEGILFIGDPKGAAIFAIDTGDKAPSAGAGPLKVPSIDGKIASLLGTTEKEILINNLAVNPTSGNAYLSVSRGRGPDATPVVMKVDREGKVDEFGLKEVKFAKAELPNPPAAGNAQKRRESITRLAYSKGNVYVAGLSNEGFDSRLRVIPFPFQEVDAGTNVEIFHGSHGGLETKSPVRTFVPFEINGEVNILAAYTCTPLVKIPVKELKAGTKVRGTTVAELGNHNSPLDMIVYQKDGKEYILMANTSRGLMKISTENIDKIAGITERVADKAGLTYETVANVKGVQRLDKLDKEHALVLQKTESGALNLETLDLP
jgi:hypothetical protein